MANILFRIIPFTLLFFSNISYTQVIAEPNITLKADVSTALFVNTLGISGDLDAVRIDSLAFIGCRLGINTFNKGDVGGSSPGSPYTDFDFLGRITIFGKFIDVSICPGFTYHKGNYSFFPFYGENKEGLFSKFEGEVRAKFYKSIVGLIAKFGLSQEGYGGLGLFVGFSTRDK